jgi:hypothetical protein
MSVQGQTIAWGSHIGGKTQSRGWLRPFLHRFGGRATGNDGATPIAVYGSWDAKREKFHPLSSDSAFDQVAVRGGQSWALAIYGSAL